VNKLSGEMKCTKDNSGSYNCDKVCLLSLIFKELFGVPNEPKKLKNARIVNNLKI